MAVKEWFRKLQPVQFYLVLFFTTAFFAVEIVASYVTHSLTLLLNAYHMLCNIVALVGCIASIKYRQRDRYSVNSSNCSSLGNSVTYINVPENGSCGSMSSQLKSQQSRSERRMKNTFGWARIDIVTMLVCCVFLASFCFSLLVEALQTLIHIDHLDEMHHPLPVMSIGASGILLNAFCYVLIGGYTFNQGVFLHVTGKGDVVLRRNMRQKPSNEGEERLQNPGHRNNMPPPKTQDFCETCRDVLGCVLVMVASIIVYFTDSSIAKFIDPIFAIISAISLFFLSYPYMKESGLILLQTIPNHINIDSLKKELLEAFPGIVNVHDLHVWQLTGEKVISTVHIIFLDPLVYASIMEQLKAFFIEMGITQVTIQPEFQKMKSDADKDDCLIRCQAENCRLSQCCSKDNDTDYFSPSKTEKLSINKRFENKEIIQSEVSLDVQKFDINKDEDVKSKSMEGISKTIDASTLDATITLQSDKNSKPNETICSVTVEVNERENSDASSKVDETLSIIS